MAGFETITVEEATECLIDYRGKTPPKTDSGIRLVTAKVIKNGRILEEPTEFIATDFYDEWMRRGLPHKLDVLVTTEAPLGEVAILRKTEKVALAQRVILLRGKPGKVEPLFLFYALQSSFTQGELKSRSSGTTVSGIKQSELRKVRIPIFPPPIQQKIAAILSAYDDLIENNLRRIKILEEMAQTLYREWFVKFRFPACAEASAGRPGHQKVKMVNSPLGKIPEGWEVKRLGDVVELAYGKGLKEQDRIPGVVPVYGSSGVVGYHNQSLVEGPGIIVGRKGNVGSVHWTDVPFFPIDTVFYVITEIPLYYVYFNLQTQNFISGDAAVPGLNRNQAYSLPFILPKANVLRFFSETVEPIFNLLGLFKRKNELLRQTRDLLLPKLISGELDVSELDIKNSEPEEN